MLTIINHHQKAQTSFCITTEYLVPCYALVVAYGNACAVNETYQGYITNNYRSFYLFANAIDPKQRCFTTQEPKGNASLPGFHPHLANMAKNLANWVTGCLISDGKC